MKTAVETFGLPQPVIQAFDDDNWLLHKRYQLQFHVGSQRYKLVSYPGATSDGLSKPFFLRAVPFLGIWLGVKLAPRELPGGWAHDQLYRGELLPRAECDEAFLYLEKVNDVGFLRRRIYYRGVRVGGGDIWDDHTVESIQTARTFNKLYKLNLGHWSLVTPPDRNINN